MARWKLMQAHHLNVPGTEWEYIENDRKTGKPKRHKFPVPLFLDPLSPTDWNYGDKDDGYIVVSNKQDNAFPGDYIFVGPPTPDMQPLDDEAREITASFADKWKHPIEALPGQGGFTGSLLLELQTEMAKSKESSTSAQAEGMKEVLASMAAMMKQNQDLMAMLAEQRIPASARRV